MHVSKEVAERSTKEILETAGKMADSAEKASEIAKGICSSTARWPEAEHAVQRLLDRDITKKQADKVLDIGRKFYDAKTDSIVSFADRASIVGGEGKTKLIGVAIDMTTKNVKTVLRESRSFEKLPARFIEVGK